MRSLACLALVSIVSASLSSRSAVAVEPPADRVVVMYFHRTQRCPTCLTMGRYAEEALKTGFARELKEGKVEFHFIDFQDPKNEALAKGYKVSGPALVAARIAGKKVAQHKSLGEIWTKVRDKGAFVEYVQAQVEDYRK